MDPNRSENFKTLLLLHSSQWSLLNNIGIFEILSFRLMIFFSKISISPLSHMGRPKHNAIIWKMKYGRAKQSEIWDQRTVLQHIRGTFGLLAFKGLLGSFGALAILCELEILFSKAAASTLRIFLKPNFLQLFLLTVHIKVILWNFEFFFKLKTIRI